MNYKLSGALLATACVALAVPVLASADVSSLDAYAGEAAVLGKPHHHRHHARTSAHSIAGQRRASTGVGRAAGGVPPGGLSRSGTHSPGERGHGGPGGGGTVSTQAGAFSRGSRTSNGAAASGGEPAEGQGLGVHNADSSTSSLTSTDVIVLCALAAMLLGSAAIARRLTRE